MPQSNSMWLFRSGFKTQNFDTFINGDRANTTSTLSQSAITFHRSTHSAWSLDKHALNFSTKICLQHKSTASKRHRRHFIPGYYKTHMRCF